MLAKYELKIQSPCYDIIKRMRRRVCARSKQALQDVVQPETYGTYQLCSASCELIFETTTYKSNNQISRRRPEPEDGENRHQNQNNEHIWISMSISA